MAPAAGDLVGLPTHPQGIQLQQYPDAREARIRGLSYGHRPGLWVVPWRGVADKPGFLLHVKKSQLRLQSLWVDAFVLSINIKITISLILLKPGSAQMHTYRQREREKVRERREREREGERETVSICPTLPFLSLPLLPASLKGLEQALGSLTSQSPL